MMTMRTLLCKAFAVAALPVILAFSFALAPAPPCAAQAQPAANTTVAALHEPPSDGAVRDAGVRANSAPSTAAAPDPEIPAIERELAAMKARIEQLEAELKSRTATVMVSTPAPAPAPKATQPLPITTAAATPALAVVQPQAEAAPSPVPEKKAKIVPFSDWDWTWLNGNPRTKDAAFDSKFFTPEIRADVSYTYDFNRPQDNSMGGSSEIFRSNEIQLEQLGVGGDFHFDNVRARLMTSSACTPKPRPAMIPVRRRASGISIPLTATSPKPTGVTTSTC